MIRERVKHFYKIRDDHSINVHDATTNVTPRGTATEIHHDSDPHISTACGESGTNCEQPIKLWLLWHASESHQLATCYSDTASALYPLGPCGYLIQYSGESLMLPANVPHAALSLPPHYLYGQTFHIKGRARDPTTIELELSALAKPSKAKDTKTALRQTHTDSYVSNVVEVLRKNRKYKGVCGLCEHFRLSSQGPVEPICNSFGPPRPLALLEDAFGSQQ
ncbi:hypothetical protein MBLNU13_g10835t1 [Cladosporium sp. NU13]